MESIVMIKREDLDYLIEEAARGQVAAQSEPTKSLRDSFYTKREACKQLGVSASGFDARRRKDPNYIKAYPDKGSRILWFKKEDIEALRR